jgi:NAD(P)-dependent dehydrogenase (short-subunit alcohol dehydrogenase family)
MAFKGLAGKTAIVTGAAGGIGAGVVARACSGPADRLLAIGADVSTENGAGSYVGAAVERFGGVDLFVNNAGVFGARTTLVDMPVDAFDKVIAVNLRGVFLGLQAVLRQMIAQGRGGAIVNTSSVGGLTAAVNCSAYNASKAGVISLTRVAANENGRFGVRVNAVCPGMIETPMLGEAMGGATPATASTPIARIGEPADIASVMAFLLSEDAAFVTGGYYVVDGGLLLR